MVMVRSSVLATLLVLCTSDHLRGAYRLLYAGAALDWGLPAILGESSSHGVVQRVCRVNLGGRSSIPGGRLADVTRSLRRRGRPGRPWRGRRRGRRGRRRGRCGRRGRRGRQAGRRGAAEEAEVLKVGLADREEVEEEVDDAL